MSTSDGDVLHFAENLSKKKRRWRKCCLSAATGPGCYLSPVVWYQKPKLNDGWCHDFQRNLPSAEGEAVSYRPERAKGDLGILVHI